MLKEYFDLMKNCLKELEKKQITDYVNLYYLRILKRKLKYMQT